MDLTLIEQIGSNELYLYSAQKESSTKKEEG